MFPTTICLLFLLFDLSCMSLLMNVMLILAILVHCRFCKCSLLPFLFSLEKTLPKKERAALICFCAWWRQHYFYAVIYGCTTCAGPSQKRNQWRILICSTLGTYLGNLKLQIPDTILARGTLLLLCSMWGVFWSILLLLLETGCWTRWSQL